MNFRFVLFVIFILLPAFLLAQPGDPGGDPDVPITGIEILLALGGVLGIKKLFIRNKTKE